MKLLFLIAALQILVFDCHAQEEEQRELKNICLTLSKDLKTLNGKCITVTDFVDAHRIPTEYGGHIADKLIVELVQMKTIRVVDRSRLQLLIDEMKIQEAQIVNIAADPKVSRKFGKLLGVDYFIVGNTSIVNNKMYISAKVLDASTGILVSSAEAYLPITESMDDQLRNPLDGNGRKINTRNQSAVDDVLKVQISDLRPGECTRKSYGSTIYYGQICFENQTGEDFIFYSNDAGPDGWLETFRTVIPNGARNCSVLIPVNWDNGPNANENTSKQARFTFLSIDEKKRAKQAFVIDKCTVKSMVLTKNNLVLLGR